jgi:hypothetical protein
MIERGIVLADGEWIGLAVFVIFVLFNLLSQASSRWKEIQQEAARRRQMPPPEPAPKRADPIEDEIAEFLRRAAERQKPAGERPPSRPAPPPVLAEPVNRPSRPPAAKPQPVVIAEPATHESVAEHVGRRMKRPKFGKVGSGKLGQKVAQPDDKIEERLREKFEHQVSSLASAQGETPAAAPAAAVPAAAESNVPTDLAAGSPTLDAASLAALLTNPVTLRQVILANEILRRPEERWTR